AQFDEGQSRVGRIVVQLTGDQKYEVTPSGNDLVLTVGEAPAAAAPAAAPAPAAPADANLVLAREDAQEVKSPAHKLTGVSVREAAGAATVRVSTDGQIAKFGVVELKNPGRLALDLHGVAGRALNAPGAGLVKGVRVAKRDDGIRVVIDAAADSMPKY